MAPRRVSTCNDLAGGRYRRILTPLQREDQSVILPNSATLVLPSWFDFGLCLPQIADLGSNRSSDLHRLRIGLFRARSRRAPADPEKVTVPSPVHQYLCPTQLYQRSNPL